MCFPPCQLATEYTSQAPKSLRSPLLPDLTRYLAGDFQGRNEAILFIRKVWLKYRASKGEPIEWARALLLNEIEMELRRPLNEGERGNADAVWWSLVKVAPWTMTFDKADIVSAKRDGTLQLRTAWMSDDNYARAQVLASWP